MIATARPVFGETKAPTQEDMPLCEWCGEKPAIHNLKITARLKPLKTNPDRYPAELICGGMVCADCGRRIALAAFDVGKRPVKADAALFAEAV